ncbi:MAG: urea transporter [Xanthomonadaceae bacterium]|nr:urea transporter [Xanthomonadaceae bacterium]
MTLRLAASGLEGEAGSIPGRGAVMFDAVLRGLGQVMFQNNSYAGLLFLAGVAASAWVLAVAALLGACIATWTAIALGAERALIRAGMYGFNGALVAIALLTFLEPSALTWACVVLASVCATLLMAALQEAIAQWKLPALTAPFVLVALLFFLAAARFGRLVTTGQLPTAALPANAVVEGVVTAATVGEGVLRGIGQVFFQANLLSGALFVLGLLVASRRACVMALAGTLAGALVAWGMGAAEPAIRAGMFGFNSALTMIALGSVFLPSGWRASAYALLGAVFAPFVAAACTAAFASVGMPAMTLPFVLTTWLFLLASRGFARLRPGAGA